ncbi:hypothetical protein, partial [Micromonospora qiuiae]|uniref:hypothetical protein n=1 Tax=Micromonospora qiuiae TaxID=502268 RepID=UPI001951D0BD
MTTRTGLPTDLAAVRAAARTAELACWRIDTAWQCLDDAYGPGGRATAASDAMWLAGNHLRRAAELLSSHRTRQRHQGTIWLAAAVTVAVTTHLHTIPFPIAAAIGYAAGIGTTTLIRQTARAWHRYRLAAVPTSGPYQPAVRYPPGCIGSIKNQIHAAQHELHAAIELTDP